MVNERTNEDYCRQQGPYDTTHVQHISSETERRTDKDYKTETDEQPHKSRTRQTAI